MRSSKSERDSDFMLTTVLSCQCLRLVLLDPFSATRIQISAIMTVSSRHVVLEALTILLSRAIVHFTVLTAFSGERMAFSILQINENIAYYYFTYSTFDAQEPVLSTNYIKSDPHKLFRRLKENCTPKS